MIDTRTEPLTEPHQELDAESVDVRKFFPSDDSAGSVDLPELTNQLEHLQERWSKELRELELQRLERREESEMLAEDDEERNKAMGDEPASKRFPTPESFTEFMAQMKASEAKALAALRATNREYKPIPEPVPGEFDSFGGEPLMAQSAADGLEDSIYNNDTINIDITKVKDAMYALSTTQIAFLTRPFYEIADLLVSPTMSPVAEEERYNLVSLLLLHSREFKAETYRNYYKKLISDQILASTGAQPSDEVIMATLHIVMMQARADVDLKRSE